MMTGKQGRAEHPRAVARALAVWGRALGGANTVASCVNNRKLERSLLHPLELC